MSIIYTTYESPLGTLTLYATASALVGLTFPTQSVNFQEPVVIDKTISSPIFRRTSSFYHNSTSPARNTVSTTCVVTIRAYPLRHVPYLWRTKPTRIQLAGPQRSPSHWICRRSEPDLPHHPLPSCPRQRKSPHGVHRRAVH